MGGRGGEEGTRREGAPSLIAALVEEKREGSFGECVCECECGWGETGASMCNG